MDFNRIFDVFDQNDDQKEIDEVSLLVDFSDHPLYWIGGFNKLISNHLFFKKYTAKMFKNMTPDSDIETLERAGEYLMFNRAWDYIKDLNVHNSFHMDCLKTKADPTLYNSLEIALKFFENLEEYEKCILLKEILDKVKEFLT
jgi:hypothetical protein